MSVRRPLPPAIVLTAGLGTRLAPLTDVRAKPAVPVAGTPLVIRILRWLSAQGVPHAVLNLHHRPETITGRVGHGQAAGLGVRYSWEPVVLGSAGGPRKALALLGPRFFIVNGDTLSNVSLAALLDTHRSSGARVTLAVMPNPAPTRYGGVTVDADGWATGFVPAGGGRPSHFVGVQVAERSVSPTCQRTSPKRRSEACTIASSPVTRTRFGSTRSADRFTTSGHHGTICRRRRMSPGPRGSPRT